MYLITKEQLEYRETIIEIINSINFENLKFIGVVDTSILSVQESYYFKINNILIEFNIYEQVEIWEIEYTFYDKNIEKYKVKIDYISKIFYEKVFTYNNDITFFYLHKSRFNFEDISKLVKYKEKYVLEPEIYSKFNHMLLIDERKRKINDIFK